MEKMQISEREKLLRDSLRQLLDAWNDFLRELKAKDSEEEFNDETYLDIDITDEVADVRVRVHAETYAHYYLYNDDYYLHSQVGRKTVCLGEVPNANKDNS